MDSTYTFLTNPNVSVLRKIIRIDFFFGFFALLAFRF